MSNNITITPANLHKQKMSTLFISVLDDLKKAEKAGLQIYMNWWAGQKRDKVCCCCLGGSAVLGFVPISEIKKDTVKITEQINDLINEGCENDVDGVHFTSDQSQKISDMTSMFDNFRRGDIGDCIGNYNSLTDIKSYKIGNAEQIYYFNEKAEEIEEEYKKGGRISTYEGVVSGAKLLRLKEDIKRFAKTLIKFGK